MSIREVGSFIREMNEVRDRKYKHVYPSTCTALISGQTMRLHEGSSQRRRKIFPWAASPSWMTHTGATAFRYFLLIRQQEMHVVCYKYRNEQWETADEKGGRKGNKEGGIRKGATREKEGI